MLDNEQTKTVRQATKRPRTRRLRVRGLKEPGAVLVQRIKDLPSYEPATSGLDAHDTRRTENAAIAGLFFAHARAHREAANGIEQTNAEHRGHLLPSSCAPGIRKPRRGLS